MTKKITRIELETLQEAINDLGSSSEWWNTNQRYYGTEPLKVLEKLLKKLKKLSST